MDNQEQAYRRDKAIVIAIVKYILIAAIAAGVIYFAQRVILIIVPFLIGFILAKASRHIADGLIRLWDKITGKKKRIASIKEPSSKPSLFQRHKVLARLFPKKGNRISRRTKVTVVVYGLLMTLVLALIVFGFSVLVAQINTGISNVMSWISEVQNDSTVLSNIINDYSEKISQLSVENGGLLSADVVDSVRDYIANIPQTLMNNLPNMTETIQSIVGTITSTLGNLPILLFSIIVILMSGFYFITEKRMLFSVLSRNVQSHSFRRKAIRLINHLSVTLFRVLGGYILLLLITFFESFFIFMIAGIPYALVWALATAVLDFMPVLGVSATIVPLAIYYLANGQYTVVVILLIGWLVISILRRFIEPPVLGNAMKMHPMATLLAMIIGVTLWGALGFLLGPVVFLITVEAARAFEVDQKLRNFLGRILNKI